MPGTSSTSSSDRAILWLVRFLGLAAGIAFLAVRIPALSGLLSVGRERDGGDLYQMVRIREFREPMPNETTTPPVFGVAPESTKILLIGDSHSRFARGDSSLTARLSGQLDGFRSVSATILHPRFFDPSDLVRQQRIRAGSIKVVIWESAERTIPDVVLGKIPQSFHAWDTTWRFDAIQAARTIKTTWFTGSEAGYQFLVMNSVATRDLVGMWNGVRYHLAGELPGSIGAADLGTKQLFLAEELARFKPRPGEMPTSFLQARDSTMVERIADGLLDASRRLEADFGAKLVVVPVPAKASLLHRQLGMEYDDFLPRLHRALERRGIRSIDTWDALMALGDRAVLRTDTHLAPASYKVLADSIIRAIGEMSGR